MGSAPAPFILSAGLAWPVQVAASASAPVKPRKSADANKNRFNILNPRKKQKS
jgi:hypothetical protein